MHAEVLTAPAAALVPALAKFKSFYLVGGTALALQIGHRRSVDFDLFSSESFPPRLLDRVKRALTPPPALTYRSAEQLNLIANEVKITFLFYPYPVIEPLLSYRGLTLVGVRELAAMKAFSIGKRLSYKDYIDWYFLLKEKHVELPEVIALAQKKFGGDFNDRLFLGQLVSLADVPTQPIDFLRGEVERSQISEYLEQTVKEFKL